MRRIERFDIYWWTADSGRLMFRYATRKPADIQHFSSTHFLIKAQPLSPTDEDAFDLVLRLQGGIWTVRSKAFDEEIDYPYSFVEEAEHAVWTDVLDDELMVIRGSFSS